MMLSNPDLPVFLKSGAVARLIPVVKDTNKEVRATSSLLSVIMAVNEFGQNLLEYMGAPITKRSKIKCFTEVNFKEPVTNDKPDGLIIIENGSQTWTAIIEAKIGSNLLNEEQIGRYLELAKINNINALITISNQFAITPKDCPVCIVSKHKYKNICISHMSWTSIATEALLLEKNKLVKDPDQAYILHELIRYLRDDSEVMTKFRMGSSWKETCTNFHQGLPKNSELVSNSIKDWHQLIKYLALQMSDKVERPVTIHLTRSQRDNIENFVIEETSYLREKSNLKAEFVIPNAAARIKLVTDLKARSINISMKIDAPDDRVQAKSSITWIYKQLEKCKNDSIGIRAYWPGRASDTYTTLGKLREDRKSLLSESTSLTPSFFEITRTIDLAGRFSSPTFFVEEAEKNLINFYKDVGQYLEAWKPSPPKIVSIVEEKEETKVEVQKVEEQNITTPDATITTPDGFLPPMVISQIEVASETIN